MADIETSLKITDKASPALAKMNKAINNVLNVLKKLNLVEVAALNEQSIEKTNTKLTKTAAVYNKIENNIQKANTTQKNFSDSIKSTTSLTDKLAGSIKTAALAFSSIYTVKKAIDFVKNALDSAQIQTNAELQLQVVLSNVKAAPNAFEQIKNKAAQIQSKGIYGDEAMIAGAAEFATYMTDKDAIQMMMDTLANYAMGMSGGGQIDTNTMVNYATNLGKIMTGAYDAMTKKGFEFTDAQKAVISGTATQSQYIEVLGKDYENLSDDMRKAITINNIINESWANLYENMSNTPTGKIIQLKNAWGDLMETVGARLSNSITQLFATIKNNMPQISSFVMKTADAFNIVIVLLDNLLQAAFNVLNFFQTNWNKIGWTVILAGSAFLTWLSPLNLVWIGISSIISLLQKVTGKTISATGIIGASVMMLYAVIKDTIAYVWNLLVSFAEFLANVFKHPIKSISVLSYNLGSYIYDVLADITAGFDTTATNIANVMIDAINLIIRAWNSLAGIINPITSKFGLELNKGGELQKISSITSEFKNQANAIRTSAQAIKPTDYWSAPRIQGLSLDDAYNQGYAWGLNIDKQFKNTADSLTKSLFNNTYADDLSDLINNIADNTGQTANNTAINQSDMQYLRDLAERDIINRFTTAQIKVEMTNNNAINSTLDIDGVVNILTDKLNEQLATQVEGVYN